MKIDDLYLVVSDCELDAKEFCRCLAVLVLAIFNTYVKPGEFPVLIFL